MSSEEAVEYGQVFLSDDYVKISKRIYESSDDFKTMRYDFKHLPFEESFLAE